MFFSCLGLVFAIFAEFQVLDGDFFDFVVNILTFVIHKKLIDNISSGAACTAREKADDFAVINIVSAHQFFMFVGPGMIFTIFSDDVFGDMNVGGIIIVFFFSFRLLTVLRVLKVKKLEVV